MKRFMVFGISYFGILKTLNILLINSTNNKLIMFIGFMAMVWVYFLIFLCTLNTLKWISKCTKENVMLPIKATVNVVVWTLLFYFMPILNFVLSIAVYPMLAPFYVLLILASTYPVTCYMLSPMVDFKNMIYASQIYGVDSFNVQAYKSTFVKRLEHLYGKDFLQKIAELENKVKIR